MIYTSLNPEKALIWRIIHRDNLPWVLQHGLHSGNSAHRAPNWVSIGNAELIDKRARHPVPMPPGGLLNDYVPFYFTPFSVMMRNIRSGRGGVQQRQNDEIVILVSSLHHLAKQGLPFLFTDMHAYYGWPLITMTWLTWIRWIGSFCRRVTSGVTRMTPLNLNATRPRRWFTSTVRYRG